MANKKISELASLASDTVADSDVLPIVDVSATSTKKITKVEFAEAIGIANTPVDLAGLGDTNTLIFNSSNSKFEPAATIPVSPGTPIERDVLAFNGTSYTPRQALSLLCLDANVCWVGGASARIGASGRVTNQSAGSTVTLGAAYVFPVTFTKAVPIYLGVTLSSTNASAEIRIAIYSDDPVNDRPSVRLFHEQVSGATGSPFTTATFTPSVGVRYWAYIRNDVAQVAFLQQSFPPFQIIGASNSSYIYWLSQSGDPIAEFTSAGTNGGNAATHPCLYTKVP